jgi:arylsulfatase A-like enzyme
MPTPASASDARSLARRAFSARGAAGLVAGVVVGIEGAAWLHHWVVPSYVALPYFALWFLVLRGALARAFATRRRVVRAALAPLIWAIACVYAASWAAHARARELASLDAFVFVLENRAQFFAYVAQMEPRALAVFGALATVGAGVLGLWIARGAAPEAARSPRARALARIAAYTSAIAFLVGLFVVRLDASEIRRRERLHALRRAFAPVFAFADDVHDRLREESTPLELDPRRLVPLARTWAPSTTGSRPSVLMLAIESLRADVVGRSVGGIEVMPHLARLARTGVVFERAYAQSTHSDYSDPTALASLHPLRVRGHHYYRRDDPWPKTLVYELFKRAGYATAMISSQNEEWGRMDRFYESASLDLFLDAARSGRPTRVTSGDTGVASEIAAGTMRAGNLDDAVTTDLALDWLGRLPAAQPFFLSMLFQNSHFPYEIAPDAPRPFQPSRIDFDASFLGYPREKTPVMRNAYHNALHESDRQLGRLLGALDRLGRARDTIVLVYGDNGECFHENGCVTHAREPVEPAVRVACVLAAPGLAPRHDDYPFALIDIPPTLLGLIGWPRHPGFQGIDALARERPSPETRRIYFHTETSFSRTDGVLVGTRDKYLFDRRTGRERVFDLALDPRERHDLAGAHPRRMAALRAAYRRYRASQLAYHAFPPLYRAYYPPSDLGAGAPLPGR